MGTAAAILKKHRGINFLYAAKTAIIQTKDEARQQQINQLYAGRDARDLQIIPSYSRKTIAIKRKKAQVTDRVTLRDTGSFYKGIQIDVIGEVIRIDSTDSKSKDLQTKYGLEIFGLGTLARTAYIRTLQPVFITEVKSFYV